MLMLGHLPSLLYTLALFVAFIFGCVFAFRSAVDYIIKRLRETQPPPHQS